MKPDRAVQLGTAALAHALLACSPPPTQPAPRSPMAYMPPLARDAPPPPRARRLTLLPEMAGDEATLLDGEGAALCRLPCTAWVPIHAGWTVNVAVDHGAPRPIAFPDALDGVAAGDSATAIAEPKRGHPGGAMALFIAGIPLTLTGGLFVGASLRDTTERGVPRTNTIGLALGVGLLAVGVPMLLGGAAWSSYSRAPAIEVIDREP